MDEGRDIREWLSFLRRRAPLVLFFLVVPLAACVFLALAYLRVAPRIYSATAIVEVPAEARKVTGIEDTDRFAPRDEEFLKTIEQNLRRMSLLQRVLARKDIAGDEGLRLALEAALESYSPVELAEEVAEWIRVTYKRGTRLITVSVENPDADTAALLANAIVEEYIGEMGETQSGSSESALTFLLGEAEKIRARLQALEDQLSSFRGFEEAILIKAKIEEQNDTVLDLSQRYRDKHPKLIQARGALAALEQQLEAELSQARGIVEGAEKAGASGPAASSADPGAELKLLEARFNVLSKDVEADRALYETIVGRIKETDITRDLNSAPVAFIERAFAPSEPVKPRDLQVLAFGVVLGGGLGLGLVLLLHAADQYSLRAREERARPKAPA